MPIDVLANCAQTPRAADPLTITMPCGGELVGSIPSVPIPDGRLLALALIDKANAAMTPLAPIFKLIDAFLAAFDMLKAVPSMDVPKLLAALEKLAGAATLLTKLVPPLSIPLLGLGFIDAVIAFLEGLLRQLVQLMRFIEQMDAVRAEVGRFPNLQVVLDVSAYNLDAVLESYDKGMAPMNRIIKLVNLLLSMAALPTLPDLASLPRNDITGCINVLRSQLRELQRIRALIPV